MRLQEKVDIQEIPQITERILEETEKQNLQMLKRVAEKEEVKVVARHFEKMIKNLHAYIKNKFLMLEEADDAILSKKPLTGFKCASCERTLKNASALDKDDFQNWNKLPSREPIAKIGPGFSKILALIRPGGVGGGGASVLGTAHHLMNESSNPHLSIDEENGNISKIDTSSKLYATLPSFNIPEQQLGSMSQRNTSMPLINSERKWPSPDQHSTHFDESLEKSMMAKANQASLFHLDKKQVSKGPILVKGGKIERQPRQQ
mmetsp:Transcript_47609/g.34875  ORF Transcript_47609/g.34875 Transcript_47609/m.34875 type:complete len:261 (+) Transcript_47609:1863-2645(+)|eukprot:CAMPEP_0202964968 /NCGR_PEP_ID=MMETSP1396-20130829/9092_1 /ASSEMBLY_ACC=CAM_ASM_000872 /TAXON_ID= /ORGANISM="Pseudokeronopsis sp., Strain Brazil" /LENGTH=260 /DNA_ID=CAMNT_0049687519 /DNA_START=1859 /DNA_END=2641 /DNA_ORIENTATION=-